MNKNPSPAESAESTSIARARLEQNVKRRPTAVNRAWVPSARHAGTSKSRTARAGSGVAVVHRFALFGDESAVIVAA